MSRVGPLNRGARIGAQIELYDSKHWAPLRSHIIARVSGGYIISAPWTTEGKTFVRSSMRGRMNESGGWRVVSSGSDTISDAERRHFGPKNG